MRVSWKLGALVIVIAAIAASRASLLTAQNEPRDGEWRYFFGQAGGTKYSPLAQINKDNVKDLRIAWRWRSAHPPLQRSYPLWRAGRNADTPVASNSMRYP